LSGEGSSVSHLARERENILIRTVDLARSFGRRNRQLVPLGQKVSPLRRFDDLTNDFPKDGIGSGEGDGSLDLDLKHRRLSGHIVVGMDDHVIERTPCIGLL
jgi:hypothetical protein